MSKFWAEKVAEYYAKRDAAGNAANPSELARLRAENAQLTAEVAGWRSTAEQHCRNEQYYRGMLLRIGEALGPEVKTCDDGTIVPDVLVAKVPEVALARISENSRLREALESCAESPEAIMGANDMVCEPSSNRADAESFGGFSRLRDARAALAGEEQE